MTVPPGDPERSGAPGEDPTHDDAEAAERAALEAQIDRERRLITTWMWRLPVLAVAGAGTWAIYEALRVHFFKRRPDPTPDWEARDPTPVAPRAFFDHDWAAVEFLFGSVPALAVRLPGPIPGGLETDGLHLAAFSRVCTHMGCQVSWNAAERFPN